MRVVVCEMHQHNETVLFMQAETVGGNYVGVGTGENRSVLFTNDIGSAPRSVKGCFL